MTIQFSNRRGQRTLSDEAKAEIVKTLEDYEK